MKNLFFVIVVLILLLPDIIFAQDSLQNNYYNAANRLLNGDSRLMVGGYAQIDYNQPIEKDVMHNGILDVHRFVMLLGYQFSPKIQFISEIEFEHVTEVYIEQAFLNYRINNWINLRGGLMLIPMGITNEYHEPPSFNGVERPFIDKYIAPTTWREIGFGAAGTVTDISMKYQAYIVNGFKSFDGSHNLSGKSGLRGGRQKGAESFMTHPNLAVKMEYFGILGLNLGISGYFGKTQSNLFDNIEVHDAKALSIADSTVVGVSMIGMDVRYRFKGWQLKGQSYYTSITNSLQYNNYNGVSGSSSDLGKEMYGYYLELGYDIFQPISSIRSELIPFLRWEEWDTHFKVEEFNANPAYHNIAITTGVGWKMTPGSVVKADLQFLKAEDDNSYKKLLNVGIGIWF